MSPSSSSSPEVTGVTQLDDSPSRFSYADATHDEVLEDLSSRFILNLPDEELASLERICFQVEQAHWYYEDFIREENPALHSLPLKKFSEMIFHACPLLHQWSHDHEQAFNTFMQYKTRVPVCGAIMLNDTWDKCVLVKGWKSSSGWGFPKGKINEDEPPVDCAVREVLEETGYNLADQIDPQDVIEMSIKEQKVSLYIVPGVPEDFPFKTKTRKEISKIEWFRLSDLPTWKRNKQVPGKFYLISPFIGALRSFINERRPRNGPRRNVKTKKVQSGQNVQARKQGALQPGDNGVNQETSYASNTGTHASAGATGNSQTHVENDYSSIPIDPHFARLLSSLTMSASAPVNNGDTRKSPAPEPSLPVTTDVSDTSSPLVLGQPPNMSNSVAEQDWSSHAPSRLSNRTTGAALTVPEHLSVSSETQHPLTVSAEPTTSVPAHPSRNGASSVTDLNLSPQSSTATFLQSPSLATVSPRSKVARRTSSTSDVSPYLSKSMEIPTSAKRLKQIALLESVADESARMTPRLVSQVAVNPTTTTFGNGYPVPSASVPPQNMAPLPSGNFGLVYSPSSVLNAGAAPEYHSDPFQVRARTSQAFHRNSVNVHPGSMSMNQSQLLALMNGGGGPLSTMPPQTYLPHSPMMGPAQGYPPHHSPYNVMPNVGPHSMNIGPNPMSGGPSPMSIGPNPMFQGGPPPAYLQGRPTTFQYPAPPLSHPPPLPPHTYPQPMANNHFPSRAPIPNTPQQQRSVATNTLLSILNGSNPSQAPSMSQQYLL